MDENEQGAYEQFQETGKQAINEFLWRSLPATTTLGEAEKIACEFFDAINKTWDETQSVAPA